MSSFDDYHDYCDTGLSDGEDSVRNEEDDNPPDLVSDTCSSDSESVPGLADTDDSSDGEEDGGWDEESDGARNGNDLGNNERSDGEDDYDEADDPDYEYDYDDDEIEDQEAFYEEFWNMAERFMEPVAAGYRAGEDRSDSEEEEEDDEDEMWSVDSGETPQGRGELCTQHPTSNARTGKEDDCNSDVLHEDDRTKPIFLQSTSPTISRMKSSIHHFQAADAFTCRTNCWGRDEVAVVDGTALHVYEVDPCADVAVGTTSEDTGRWDRGAAGGERSTQREERQRNSDPSSSGRGGGARARKSSAGGAAHGSNAFNFVHLCKTEIHLDDSYISVSWSADGDCIAVSGIEGRLSFFVVERRSEAEARPAAVEKRRRVYVDQDSGGVASGPGAMGDAGARTAAVASPECESESRTSSIRKIRWIGLVDMSTLPLPEVMCNSIRFTDNVFDEKCCLVASQAGYIFALKQPTSESVSVSSLYYRIPAHMKSDMVSSFTAETYTTLDMHGELLNVDGIGDFEFPLNFAAASPNGEYIAACGDVSIVFVVSSRDGFSNVTRLRFPHSVRAVGQVSSDSCQYLSWNADSTLVAASSDSLYAVAVWQVATGNIAAYYHNHARPVLPICFHPTEPRWLVYAESQHRLHLKDVKLGKYEVLNVEKHMSFSTAALLRLVQGDHIEQEELIRELSSFPSPRTHGLAVTEKGIYWKLKDSVLHFKWLTKWSTRAHARFPESFKAVCREALKGASSSSCPFHSLTDDLLLGIFDKAAFPLSAWQ